MSDLRRCIERAARESGVDLQTARRIERYFRDQWGGQRIYITKAPPKREHKAEAIGKAIASGSSIAAACSELGVSRSTVYRRRKEARSSAIATSDGST